MAKPRMSEEHKKKMAAARQRAYYKKNKERILKKQSQKIGNPRKKISSEEERRANFRRLNKEWRLRNKGCPKIAARKRAQYLKNKKQHTLWKRATEKKNREGKRRRERRRHYRKKYGPMAEVKKLINSVLKEEFKKEV